MRARQELNSIFKFNKLHVNNSVYQCADDMSQIICVKTSDPRSGQRDQAVKRGGKERGSGGMDVRHYQREI